MMQDLDPVICRVSTRLNDCDISQNTPKCKSVCVLSPFTPAFQPLIFNGPMRLLAFLRLGAELEFGGIYLAFEGR